MNINPKEVNKECLKVFNKEDVEKIVNSIILMQLIIK